MSQYIAGPPEVSNTAPVLTVHSSELTAAYQSADERDDLPGWPVPAIGILLVMYSAACGCELVEGKSDATLTMRPEPRASMCDSTA